MDQQQQRLATLFLCDIVNSTAFVEAVGDARAAAAMGRFDALARSVFLRFAGREIDKSDGFLVLFERPIDAVGAAIALHSELVGQELRVRVGIHLGEVILRSNPAEDVARGAKPLEVEGISKGVAARIMSLGREGQTLLTRSAFDLARRSAVGSDLMPAETHWLAHGPYILKGIEDPFDVYEVGVSGVAPLSPPAESEKVRRAIAPGEEDAFGWRPAPGQPVPRRDSWILDSRLGEGGFGEVWLAHHHKTREKRVFKFCFAIERMRALKREVTLFRLLKQALQSRDDIARVLDWNLDRPPYYIEIDWTEGGDLLDWAERQGGIEKVPVETRIELMAQVAMAISAAHSIGVLHKDIKPRNVLIATGPDGRPRARLTDFGIGLLTDQSILLQQGITESGFTEALDTTASNSATGTRLYMAPELIEGKTPLIQSDIYSVGVMLYQAVIGDFSRFLATGWREEISDPFLAEDIADCVQGDPARRLRSGEVLAERLRALDRRRAEAAEKSRQDRQREELLATLKRTRERRRILGGSLAIAVVFLVSVTTLYFNASRARDRAEELAWIAEERARQLSIKERELQETNEELIEQVRDKTERAVSELALAGKLDRAVDTLASLPDRYRRVWWRDLLRSVSSAYVTFAGPYENFVWGSDPLLSTEGYEIRLTTAQSSAGATIRVTSDGREVFSKPLQAPARVATVRASGDRTWVAALHANGRGYTVWDFRTGREYASGSIPLPEPMEASTIALSVEHNLLLAMSGNTMVVAIDLETGAATTESLRADRGTRQFGLLFTNRSGNRCYVLTEGEDIAGYAFELPGLKRTHTLNLKLLKPVGDPTLSITDVVLVLHRIVDNASVEIPFVADKSVGTMIDEGVLGLLPHPEQDKFVLFMGNAARPLLVDFQAMQFRYLPTYVQYPAFFSRDGRRLVGSAYGDRRTVIVSPFDSDGEQDHEDTLEGLLATSGSEMAQQWRKWRHQSYLSSLGIEETNPASFRMRAAVTEFPDLGLAARLHPKELLYSTIDAVPTTEQAAREARQPTNYSQLLSNMENMEVGPRIEALTGLYQDLWSNREISMHEKAALSGVVHGLWLSNMAEFLGSDTPPNPDSDASVALAFRLVTAHNLFAQGYPSIAQQLMSRLTNEEAKLEAAVSIGNLIPRAHFRERAQLAPILHYASGLAQTIGIPETLETQLARVFGLARIERGATGVAQPDAEYFELLRQAIRDDLPADAILPTAAWRSSSIQSLETRLKAAAERNVRLLKLMDASTSLERWGFDESQFPSDLQLVQAGGLVKWESGYTGYLSHHPPAPGASNEAAHPVLKLGVNLDPNAGRATAATIYLPARIVRNGHGFRAQVLPNYGAPANLRQSGLTQSVHVGASGSTAYPLWPNEREGDGWFTVFGTDGALVYDFSYFQAKGGDMLEYPEVPNYLGMHHVFASDPPLRALFTTGRYHYHGAVAGAWTGMEVLFIDGKVVLFVTPASTGKRTIIGEWPNEFSHPERQEYLGITLSDIFPSVFEMYMLVDNVEVFEVATE